MVKLGFQVLNAGPLATPANVVAMAQKAEALGYDSIVVTDHIVIPRQIQSRYPYNATGRLFVPPDADYLEPLSMLCFLAGATRTIRFGPSVLVLPYRNPVLTAKMLATIDVLSGGRLFVGVGAGWLAEEFSAMGAPPFASRGAVTDEWIEIMLKLWTEANPVYDGKFYQIREIGCFPKPAQKPHPARDPKGGQVRPELARLQGTRGGPSSASQVSKGTDRGGGAVARGLRVQRALRRARGGPRWRYRAARSRGAGSRLRRNGRAGGRAAQAHHGPGADAHHLRLPDRAVSRTAGDDGAPGRRGVAEALRPGITERALETGLSGPRPRASAPR